MIYTHIDQYVVTHTSARRYAHCVSTAKETGMLLERYAPSYQDPVGTHVIGVWHDVAREWSDEDLLLYCLKHAIPMELEEQRFPMLLHGAVAADLLSHRYPDVPMSWKSAIRWHTIGSCDMGVLGAALFAADYMEPLRRHLVPGEREMLLESRSLEDLCRTIVDKHLRHLLEKGKTSALSTRRLETFLAEGGRFV